MSFLLQLILHLILTHSSDQVKVTHISIENISITMTDRVNTTNAIVNKVMHRLSFGIFTFDLGSL